MLVLKRKMLEVCFLIENIYIYVILFHFLGACGKDVSAMLCVIYHLDMLARKKQAASNCQTTRPFGTAAFMGNGYSRNPNHNLLLERVWKPTSNHQSSRLFGTERIEVDIAHRTAVHDASLSRHLSTQFVITPSLTIQQDITSKQKHAHDKYSYFCTSRNNCFRYNLFKKNQNL